MDAEHKPAWGFVPEVTLTAEEATELWRAMGMTVSEELYQRLSPALQRHFRSLTPTRCQ